MLACAWLIQAGAAKANPWDANWCEYRTPDLRVITPLDPEAIRALVGQLEAVRAVAGHYLPGEPNPDEAPLVMVLFPEGQQLRRALRDGALAGFMVPALAQSLLVVAVEPRAPQPFGAVFHEYGHYLLRTRRGIRIPVWFDEGFASFLATVRVEDGVGVSGTLTAQSLAARERPGGVSLRRVLSESQVHRWPLAARQSYYAWSLLLVHRLLLGHETGLDDRRRELADHLAAVDTHGAGASGLLARLGPLERELDRYAERRLPAVHHSLPETSHEVLAARCLDARERTRWISLAILQHNPGEAIAQLRTQLTRAPDDPALRVVLSLAEEAAGNPEAALAEAEIALQHAPDDVAARIRVAEALSIGCLLRLDDDCRARWDRAVPLLRAALTQAPDRIDAIFTLGLSYLYLNRPGEARNYLQIVHDRQPWAPHVNFYLGDTYRLLGDTRARAHLGQARDWSPTPLWRDLAAEALARLDADG
ncbi:MAG: hypothetical protein KF911_10190 [Pseudomonadales bacterium]|nr:hypothetical protein [Pseudomonadales bacterium]